MAIDRDQIVLVAITPARAVIFQSCDRAASPSVIAIFSIGNSPSLMRMLYIWYHTPFNSL
jgi:hypothetical protein